MRFSYLSAALSLVRPALARAGIHAVLPAILGLQAWSGQPPVAEPAPQPPASLQLEDLWEDTAVTRGLVEEFRVYQRRRLPNHLHEQLKLYIVRSGAREAPRGRTAVVFIHGGGWSSGDPDQWFPQCRYFALRGAAGISVQYRLKSQRTTIADCLEDCALAIR
jgi:acetyl esterase/lipase